jgi:crotonobetainyl-CoA:carnitine CoA-transferase CaiB-like acyl-CoA transferase
MLDPILQRHFETNTRTHWLERLERANVPCAPIATVAEVAHNPHLEQRQMILQAVHPTFDHLIVPGSPLKTAGVVGVPDTRSPDLGEHTESVLGSLLGYDTARIAQLRAEKII